GAIPLFPRVLPDGWPTGRDTVAAAGRLPHWAGQGGGCPTAAPPGETKWAAPPPGLGRVGGGSVLGQRGQELGVGVRLREAVEQQLDALVGAHGTEHAAHRPDHAQRAFLEEQLLAAST